MNKNLSQGLVGQTKWTKKHKENNPTGEARRKGAQRQREAVARFHIARNYLYGYPFPETLNIESETFKRVSQEYLETVAEKVEIIETIGE